MAETLPYRIEYADNAEEHLRTLSRKDQATVVDAVERQLRFETGRETRNRKPMRPNPIAPWEMRVGHLRVYYDIERDPEPTVYILAIGTKERNRVRIGKEVVQL